MTAHLVLLPETTSWVCACVTDLAVFHHSLRHGSAKNVSAALTSTFRPTRSSTTTYSLDFYCTLDRTSIVSIVPQHMQRRSFGNRLQSVHDQPTSKTHHEIPTRSGKTVHSTSALAHWASQLVEQCSLFREHHVFQAIGNYDVMLDVGSQHHLWMRSTQCFLSLSRTPPPSRVRYVPRPSTRPETTGRAALRRVEQTCACQTTRFPSQPVVL